MISAVGTSRLLLVLRLVLATADDEAEHAAFFAPGEQVVNGGALFIDREAKGE